MDTLSADLRYVADLSGTLQDWRPVTLIAFLADTAKTGMLTVKGRHHEVLLWLRRGVPVRAHATGSGDLLDALVDAMRTPAGEFSFVQLAVDEPDEVPPEVGSLLRRAAAALRDWEGVSQIVPSLQLLVRLQTGDDAAALSNEAWSVSVAVAAGNSSVAAVATHLGWSALATCRAIRELVVAGRATLEAPPSRRRLALVDGPTIDVTGGDWHASRRPLWPGAGATHHWEGRPSL